MADLYRIFGSQMSPCSVKIRCYFGFKAIPHQWILRNRDSRAEHHEYAKLPIIPRVVDHASNVRWWPTRLPAIRCFEEAGCLAPLCP
jgi:hypothetical protein